MSATGVDAGCEVFPECGGCTWRDASSDTQKSRRLEALRRALSPAHRDIPVEYTASAERDGWRTRARLGWRVARSTVSLGFRARSSHDIVAISRCPVLHSTLDRSLELIRPLLSGLSDRGELSLALGREGRCVLSLHPEGDLRASAFSLGERWMALGLQGVALWVPGASVPAIDGDPRPVIDGPDGAPLVLGIDGFAQAHSVLNTSLAGHVAREAEAAGRSVLELYAGAGNFTVLLASVAKGIAAVESDPGSLAALGENLRARGSAGVVRIIAGDAAEHASDGRPDVFVMDPPRKGAREVCEEVLRRTLAGSSLRRVVYVSCDPPTLGRDLAILAGAFAVTRLAAFEMFPQTPHTEVVATLERSRRAQ